MPGFIDDMMDKVDRRFQEHGLTPELDTLLDGRPRRNYSKRTHDELLVDVNQLYDKLVVLTRERDELRGALNEAKEQLRILNLKFWICSIAVVALTGTVGFLAKELFARLH